jgi:hypothetical protein
VNVFAICGGLISVFANNQSCRHDNTLIRSLLSEVECLKEQCNQLSFQLAEIKNKSVVTVSTQTDECVKLSSATTSVSDQFLMYLMYLIVQ